MRNAEIEGVKHPGKSGGPGSCPSPSRDFFFLIWSNGAFLRCPRALFRGLDIVKNRDVVRIFFLFGRGGGWRKENFDK